jgi:hypothetical protein
MESDTTTPSSTPSDSVPTPSSTHTLTSLRSTIRLLVQGISPPLSTPLWWLATYFSHPDGFLYISLHMSDFDDDDHDLFGPINDLNSSIMSHSVSSMGGNSLSGSLYGGFGISNMIRPSTLHAASNAINVVYQNLPNMPTIPSITNIQNMSLPNMSSFFGSAQSTVAAPPSSSSSLSTSSLLPVPDVDITSSSSSVPIDSTLSATAAYYSMQPTISDSPTNSDSSQQIHLSPSSTAVSPLLPLNSVSSNSSSSSSSSNNLLLSELNSDSSLVSPFSSTPQTKIFLPGGDINQLITNIDITSQSHVDARNTESHEELP